MVEIPDYDVHDEVQIDPARSALLVIDMQNDFVKDGGTLRVSDAEATVPTIQRLRALARDHGMRVVYSQDTHEDGAPEWQIWPEHARSGTWGWQIVDELSALEPFDLEASLRQTAFLFAGKVTTAEGLRFG